MVQKVSLLTRIICICAVCVACFCTHTTALASTLNTSHDDLVGGILSRTFFTDYLVYYPSSSETRVVVGGLSFVDDVFSWDDSKTYIITTNEDGSLSYTVLTGSSGTVNLSGKVAYSSLADYPLFLEGGGLYEKVSIFVVVVIGICSFVIFTFGFFMRRRV